MRIAAAWPWLVLAGCAAPVPEVPIADPGCAAQLASVDARVAAAGVSDAGARRVEGFEVLRVDRPLAALAPAPQDPAFTPWLARMRVLDAAAREFEMDNLGVEPAEQRAVRECAARVHARIVADSRLHPAIRAAAVVPDDYSTLRRALGLYPLTSVGFLAGVQRLHAEQARRLVGDPALVPARGRRVRFEPRTGAPDPGAVGALPRDALGIPNPSEQELRALFERHAPVFEVDVVSPDDRLARLSLDADGSPRADTANPVIYQRTSHAILGGTPVLQLEYVAWFASRPPDGPLDILAGALDGLVWRVTLDGTGRALVYDSIHPCGCYHVVFPTARVRLLPPPARYEEPLQIAPQVPDGGQRLVLRVAAGTHYLDGVYRDRSGDRAGARPGGPAPAARPGAVAYDVMHYDALRSMPRPGGGRRSLFGPDGLVAASARPERFVLWMAGIDSPGAMRQSGRQAIAFVGRRHFDDADLLARYFTPAAP